MKHIKNDSKPCYLRLSASVVEMFDKVYPLARSRFCELAMKKALEDKILFDKIFFQDILNE